MKFRMFIGTVLLFSLSIAIRAQVSHADTSGRRERDIVQALLPRDEPPEVPRLAPNERPHVVHMLLEDQRHAEGARAQQIAFLLAALGVRYTQNRDYLTHVLQGCSVPSIKHKCSDETGQFLIQLYKHGHHDVLAPLLLVGSASYNADLSEDLGGFYGEVLSERPNEFLGAIRSASPQKQDEVCRMAGQADGGGMSPDDLEKLHTKLVKVGGALARRCLREVEAGAKAH